MVPEIKLAAAACPRQDDGDTSKSPRRVTIRGRRNERDGAARGQLARHFSLGGRPPFRTFRAKASKSSP